MSELKAYTEEELAEHQHLYDEVFTPVWESEGQYCRAGGGQYEKSFAWWAFKHQQSKVDELQNNINLLTEALDIKEQLNQKLREREDELQKRVDDLERKLQIKTRHCEFYEQSRKGHRSLAIHRKKQINSALEQIEKLYSKAESDYEKDRNPYYDGMLSALDLAEQAVRGELAEQALKGGEE